MRWPCSTPSGLTGSRRRLGLSVPIAIALAARSPERVSALGPRRRYARMSAADDYPRVFRPSSSRGSCSRTRIPMPSGRRRRRRVVLFAPTHGRRHEVPGLVRHASRRGASPANARDVLGDDRARRRARRCCPHVRVPTLVIHRTRQPVRTPAPGPLRRRAHPERKVRQVPGRDHIPWTGDADALLDEIEEFLTGRRARFRGSRARDVLFTDIVDSTQRPPGWATRRGGASWTARRDRARRARPLRRSRGQHDRRRVRRRVRRPDRGRAAPRCAIVVPRRPPGSGARRRPHRRVRTAGRRPRRARGPHRGAGRGACRRPTKCSSPERSATWSRVPAWPCSRGRARAEGPRPAVGAVRGTALSRTQPARTLA